LGAGSARGVAAAWLPRHVCRALQPGAESVRLDSEPSEPRLRARPALFDPERAGGASASHPRVSFSNCCYGDCRACAAAGRAGARGCGGVAPARWDGRGLFEENGAELGSFSVVDPVTTEAVRRDSTTEAGRLDGRGRDAHTPQPCEVCTWSAVVSTAGTWASS